MAKVINLFKTVRNNWKKTLFATVALSYGVNYGREKYLINEVMREYCKEAAKYGDVTIPCTDRFHKVLVILNPTANKKSATETFEKYCAPIFHLAGIPIDIVKTESEGHARQFIEALDRLPDSIIVAGGDGTLSEIVTGIFRRNEPINCPIGILPVGQMNTFAKKLLKYSMNSRLDQVEGLANAAITIVRGKLNRVDVMKIEVLPQANNISSKQSIEPESSDNSISADEQVLSGESDPSDQLVPSGELVPSDEPKPKPVYALSTFQWGAFRDAWTLRDKYWYTGPLRDYITFIFNSVNSDISWNCSAKIIYTPPCSGCKNCYIQPIRIVTNKRWWHSFLPRSKTNSNTGPDYSKIVNINCSKTTEIDVTPTEIFLTVNNPVKYNIDTIEAIPNLLTRFGKSEIGCIDFISSSWERINEPDNFESVNDLRVRTIDILPNETSKEDKELYFSIDNEAYEVKPIRVSLLPKAITMYTL